MRRKTAIVLVVAAWVAGIAAGMMPLGAGLPIAPVAAGVAAALPAGVGAGAPEAFGLRVGP